MSLPNPAAPDPEGLGPDVVVEGDVADVLRLQGQLVNAIREAVIVTDASLRMTVINDAAARLYGLDPAAAIGRELVALSGSDLTESAREAAHDELISTGCWSGRVRQRAPGDGWRDVELSIRLLTDEAGALRGALCVANDVTEREKARREAVERADFAAAVLESLPGRTCVLDQWGTVLSTNVRYRDEGPLGAGPQTGPRLGGSYPDWLGRTVGPAAADSLRRVLSGTLAEFTTDFETVRKRRRRWTEITAVPVAGESGGAVVTHADATVRKQTETTLTLRATHDALTGLPNRVLLADRLGHALSRAARANAEVGLLFCDLDGLRAVNNSMGHLAGDHTLVTIANRLRAVCRASDTVARVSGDEFVIVLEDVEGPQEVEEVASRIIDALAQPVVIDGKTAKTGASIGVLLSKGVATPTIQAVEALLRDADCAMYVAKESGRGRFVWFTPEMRDRPRARPGIRQTLTRLLNR